MGLSSPKKLSELFDQLRKEDPTNNQPIGTDGPFWAIGGLGMLGETGMQAITMRSESDGAEKCAYQHSPEVSLKQMYDQLKKVTGQIVGTGCSFEAEWNTFAKKNQTPLLKYFKDWSDLAHAADHKTPDYFVGLHSGPDTKDALLRKLAANACNNMQLPLLSPKCAEISRSFLADPKGSMTSTFTQFFIALPASAEGSGIDLKLRADRQTLEEAYGGKDRVDAIINAVKDQSKKYRDAHTSLKADQAVIGKLEKELYQSLKNSPSYRSCIEALPQEKRKAYQEAKKGCEEFSL